MKKVAFHLNCLAYGGTERVVSNLANRFAKEGYETIVATEWREKREYSLDSAVRREIVGIDEKGEEGKRGRLWKICQRHLRLRAFVKKERPDVLLAFGRKANYRSLLATVGMKQKVVVSVRTDPTGHYDRLSDRIQIPLLFRRAAGFVFQTVGQRDFFPAFVREKSVLILNPIHEKYLSAKRPASTEKTVAHSGRIQGFKNHEMLIRAFWRTHEKHPEYVLKCYGPDTGVGALQRAQACARELGAQEFVKFMGPCDDLEKQLPKAEIYAFSSDWEGLPNALMEAMAMGMPVVATDCPCGGPATLIRDGENGLLVPVGDEEAMANALCRLMDDPALARRLGENAKKIRDLASEDAVFARWRDWLEGLEQASGRGGVSAWRPDPEARSACRPDWLGTGRR